MSLFQLRGPKLVPHKLQFMPYLQHPAKFDLDFPSLLGLEKVGQNSCRIMPKYGEVHKGEEEGATTEEGEPRKREGCCDKRRKEKKTIRRRHGKRKLRQMSKLQKKDRSRYDMTW